MSVIWLSMDFYETLTYTKDNSTIYLLETDGNYEETSLSSPSSKIIDDENNYHYVLMDEGDW